MKKQFIISILLFVVFAFYGCSNHDEKMQYHQQITPNNTVIHESDYVKSLQF